MKTDNFVHPWLHLACKEVLQAIRCTQLYKSTPRGLLLSLSIINHYLTLYSLYHSIKCPSTTKIWILDVVFDLSLSPVILREEREREN